MWLIYFTGRELKQRETKAQICGELKMPNEALKFKRKNTNPQNPNLIQYLIETFQHFPW